MTATVINAVLVLIGSAVGLLLRGRISEKLTAALTRALGLCVLGIGLSGLLGAQDMLCVILCMAAGTLLGTVLRIEDRLERAGELLRTRVLKGKGGDRFAEGAVNAFLLFCVGAMSITGSIQAGLNGDYRILLSKSVLDGVSSVSFAAAMGPGVILSVIPLVLYQGAITLLAAWVGPYFPAEVINGMSAVGGALITALGLNMLEVGRTRFKVGDMLPAMFLPILYLPLSHWLGSLLPF